MRYLNLNFKAFRFAGNMCAVSIAHPFRTILRPPRRRSRRILVTTHTKRRRAAPQPLRHVAEQRGPAPHIAHIPRHPPSLQAALATSPRPLRKCAKELIAHRRCAILGAEHPTYPLLGVQIAPGALGKTTFYRKLRLNSQNTVRIHHVPDI